MATYKSPYSNEKRKNTRIPIKFLLLIDISPNVDPNVIFEGDLLNISEGGVLVQLRDFKIARYIKPLEKFPPNSEEIVSKQLREYKVWLNFTLPGVDYRIKTPARIVRAEKNFRLAMQYLEIPEEAHKLIKDYIESEKETV